MARQIFKSMEMIGYVLTPEFSLNQNNQFKVPRVRTSLKARLVGCAKSATWILISIMLSLALGQLN
jgi:hypothetical protein